MTSYMRYRITVSLIAIAFGQPAFADIITVPPVPSAIQVPTGNTAYLKGQAIGTQNYICLPSGAPSGFSWTFFGPQATLFLTFKFFNNDIRQQITTHFLSPNPDEGGVPRPTWQSSLDTSAVWGRSIASSSDSAALGAIPWLLLQVVGAERGPTGGASLTQTTYIHRLNTTGGIAPVTGCSVATNVGATALVPYTADYYFYRASR